MTQSGNMQSIMHNMPPHPIPFIIIVSWLSARRGMNQQSRDWADGRSGCKKAGRFNTQLVVLLTSSLIQLKGSHAAPKRMFFAGGGIFPCAESGWCSDGGVNLDHWVTTSSFAALHNRAFQQNIFPA